MGIYIVKVITILFVIIVVEFLIEIVMVWFEMACNGVPPF